MTASAGLAEQFVRFVRRSPPRRLERLMRSPARHLVLGGIFWQMPRYLDRQRAAGVDASVRWEITGRADRPADVYDLEVRDSSARVLRRSGVADPRVTITVDGVEFLRIASGSMDPMQAYFKGRIKLAGDMMLAAKIASLFRIPGATRA